MYCYLCHTEIHKTETIKMYENDSQTDFEELIPYDRCNGSGNFPGKKKLKSKFKNQELAKKFLLLFV